MSDLERYEEFIEKYNALAEKLEDNNIDSNELKQVAELAFKLDPKFKNIFEN